MSLLVHTKGTSIRVILKVTHTKDQHPYKELGTQHEMTHSSLFVNSFLQPNFNSHGSLDLLLFQNNGCIRELSVDSPCLWSLVFSLDPLSPSNWSPKINGGGNLGNSPGWIFFVVGQRQRNEWAQLDVSQLIYFGIFVQTMFLNGNHP